MGEPNFLNRTLFHGDNLPFLRGLNSESVHLIATDPPFNKGRDFHATPDSLARGAKFQDRWSWDDDVEGEWIDVVSSAATLRGAARLIGPQRGLVSTTSLFGQMATELEQSDRPDPMLRVDGLPLVPVRVERLEEAAAD